MHADTDIDTAIAEFELAIGYEIKAIQRERHSRCLTEIARLEQRIARLRSQHRRTVEPLKELCGWRARQIMFELGQPTL